MTQTTRRGFMKTTAGISSAFLLPAVTFDYGISPELVRKFCNQESQRFDLAQPFVQSDYCFATDGRTALRLFDAERFAGDSAGKLPNMIEIFETLISGGRWHDWPEANYEIGKYGQCVYCGSEWEDCPECLGGGCEREEFQTLCRRCKGEGEIPIRCDRCRGQDELPERQMLDSRVIRPRYHHLISQLPNVRYRRGGEVGQCVTFRFDGGSGLLMPMRGLTSSPTG